MAISGDVAMVSIKAKWSKISDFKAQLLNGKNIANGFLVSKETVVLRRWERSKQKYGFIKRVDKG